MLHLTIKTQTVKVTDYFIMSLDVGEFSNFAAI